jgi:probable F420-dependent oxidoreductase
MRVGAFLAPWGPLAAPAEVNRFADTVEAARFRSLWVGDHIVFPDTSSTYHYNPDERSPFDPTQPHLEPHTLVTFLAGRTTTRIDLGISVFLVPLRNPLIAAKSLADLQTLSGGRLLLGIGVGWMREEFEALHADYEHRGAITDEYVAVYRHIWSGDPSDFEGEHYSFSALGALPKPATDIPIIVGGNSPAAMRRAARLGDGWHPLRLDPDEAASAIEDMRQMAEDQGRDGGSLRIVLRNRLLTLERTLVGPSSDSALIGEIRELLRSYADAGVDDLIVEFPYPGSPPDLQIAWLEWFGEHDLASDVRHVRTG